VVIARTRSSAVRPGSRCVLRKKLVTDRWVIAIPFGRPVEPDV
jgi:hypothetical protein